MIHAFAALLCCQLAGEFLVRLAHLPVPGPILGLAILLLVLAVHRSVPDPLEDTSLGLLRHLSLLFVPAGVGIIKHLERLQDEWAAIGIALVLSTLLSLGVTAGVFILLTRRGAAAQPSSPTGGG